MALLLNKARELDFKHARIHAFKNSCHSLDDHLATPLSIANAYAHFAGEWKEEEVRNPHAVNRRNKGGWNSTGDFLDIVQVLHDPDEPQNGAQDSNRRREPARRLENGGQSLF